MDVGGWVRGGRAHPPPGEWLSGTLNCPHTPPHSSVSHTFNIALTLTPSFGHRDALAQLQPELPPSSPPLTFMLAVTLARVLSAIVRLTLTTATLAKTIVGHFCDALHGCVYFMFVHALRTYCHNRYWRGHQQCIIKWCAQNIQEHRYVPHLSHVRASLANSKRGRDMKIACRTKNMHGKTQCIMNGWAAQ